MSHLLASAVASYLQAADLPDGPAAPALGAALTPPDPLRVDALQPLPLSIDTIEITPLSVAPLTVPAIGGGR